jgi:hypothetical protein
MHVIYIYIDHEHIRVVSARLLMLGSLVGLSRKLSLQLIL